MIFMIAVFIRGGCFLPSHHFGPRNLNILYRNIISGKTKASEIAWISEVFRTLFVTPERLELSTH